MSVATGAPVSVRVPGDKSISHRSLLFAALADGASIVRHILPSADVRSTAAVLRALGVEIGELTNEVTVTGRGLRGLRAPTVDLDCGNSGTTARLLSGVLAAQPFDSRVIGDASLSRRPMRRVSEPLGRMGARLEFEGTGDVLPMRVHGGPLRPADFDFVVASAQVKSAVLLAGLAGGVAVSLREPVVSRDHTERMLAWLGVSITALASAEPGGGPPRIATFPSDAIPPFDLEVPGDPSSAAFLIALAVLSGNRTLHVERVCLNPTRLGFFDTLREMGGVVRWHVDDDVGAEPIGRMEAAPGELRGVHVGGARVPAMIDELPLLACMATRARGETVVTGASELRVKESDRIAAVVGNLRAIGADADELPVGFVVRGGAGALRGSIRTFGDHRIAMAFGVLGALDGNDISVDDPGCVDVSYPGFWEDLSRARG
ncbi:MAG TPA: 3-phosphoshikimate 1-carboxyvinyltransferase [Gemmatimonadaceae bacterium]|nr:3-phosphoshikimate 1-carboxyvinyltransferase [Gemmatimonadaceae bacterium]